MSEHISLAQIKDDVHHVIPLNEAGKDMDQIAEELSLSRDYIQTILICAQGFMEDDIDAVAHLVEMSL